MKKTVEKTLPIIFFTIELWIYGIFVKIKRLNMQHNKMYL